MLPTILSDDPKIEPFDEKVYAAIDWFHGMKDGECRASNATLALLIKPADPQPRSVQNSLNRLEERAYIRREYKDAAKRNRVKIVPLIELHIVRNGDDRKETSEGRMIDERTGDDRASEPAMTRVRIGSKNSEEEVSAGSAGGDVALLIEEFRIVNPSHSRLFANKTQRAAAERLVAKYGIGRAIGLVKYVGQIREKQYAPSITTPYELEAKLGKLAEFAAKEKKRGPKLVTI